MQSRKYEGLWKEMTQPGYWRIEARGETLLKKLSLLQRLARYFWDNLDTLLFTRSKELYLI